MNTFENISVLVDYPNVTRRMKIIFTMLNIQITASLRSVWNGDRQPVLLPCRPARHLSTDER